MNLNRPLALTGAALALLALSACNSPKAAAPGAPAATSSAAPSPTATTAAAVPETAAAAKSAASAYFALYGAGQYAAVYPMIDPADRAQIQQSVWVAVHQTCRNQSSAGLTYAVSHPVAAGSDVVFSVGFAGAAAALGSEQVTFEYVGGQWYYVPSDEHVYAGHTAAQGIAAAKADGLCS
jgi:hypothetical protein